MTTLNSAPPAATAPAADRPRPLADLLLGLAGSALIVWALVLLVSGAGADAGVEAGPVPAFQILAPAAGERIEGAVVLDFSVAEEIGPSPTGWGTGELHLHARIDGQEFMPAPADVRRVAIRRYQWALPSVSPGEHTLQLFWAGPDHRALPEGASEPITVHVE